MVAVAPHREHAVVGHVDLDPAVRMAEPADRRVRHGPGHASPPGSLWICYAITRARGAGAAGCRGMSEWRRICRVRACWSSVPRPGSVGASPSRRSAAGASVVVLGPQPRQVGERGRRSRRGRRRGGRRPEGRRLHPDRRRDGRRNRRARPRGVRDRRVAADAHGGDAGGDDARRVRDERDRRSDAPHRGRGPARRGRDRRLPRLRQRRRRVPGHGALRGVEGRARPGRRRSADGVPGDAVPAHRGRPDRGHRDRARLRPRDRGADAPADAAVRPRARRSS